MPTGIALKAPERPCKGCRATIPAQPRGPSRPQEFCSPSCRRAYFHSQEQAEAERERAEARERQRRAMDERFHGKRVAKRRAKERAWIRAEHS